MSPLTSTRPALALQWQKKIFASQQHFKLYFFILKWNCFALYLFSFLPLQSPSTAQPSPVTLSASHIPLFTCPHIETSNWITMADRQVFQTLRTQLLFHLQGCLSLSLNEKVQTINSIKTTAYMASPFVSLPALGFKSDAFFTQETWARHIKGFIRDHTPSTWLLNITVMLFFRVALSSSHYTLFK